ncbi:MAG: CHASE2 domain-containing protein, partial [Proteobacteria bacterium]|nr:CHASE2 domain-containing protein [Pseudomonadota bacterium]
MNAIRKRPHLFLGLFITILFLAFHYVGFGFLDTMNKKVYDVMMHLRAGGDSSGDIVLVAVDDDSIEKLGRWPWPRSILARGLDKINAGSPRVIGLSVILSEPEISDGLKEIEGLRALYEKKLATAALAEAGGMTPSEGPDPILSAMDEARSRLDNDAALAAALSRAGNVVLPVFFKPTDVPGARKGEPDPLLEPHALGAWDGEPGAWYPRADRITQPIEPFIARATGLGHINLLFDPEDSTYRKEWLYYEYDGLFIPSYEVALAAEYLGQTQDQTGARPGVGVSVGPLFIPTDWSGACLVNFRGGDGSFKIYSFFDVINDKIPASVFTDKAVIVTPTAKGIQNPLSTPMGTMNVGEFSANALATFLGQDFVTEPASSLFIRFVLILLVGVLITLVLPKIKAAAAAGVFAGLVVILSTVSAWLFSSKGMWISPTYPLAMLVAGYI